MTRAVATRSARDGAPPSPSARRQPAAGPALPAPLRAAWPSVAALGLLLAAWPASAADLNGTAEAGWAQEEANDFTHRFFRQSYLLDWRRRFSLPISYRLSLRLQEDRGETLSGGQSSDLRTRILTPTASLDYRIEELGIIASWRLHDEDQLGRTRDRTTARASLSLLIRPFEHGDGTVAGDRLAYHGFGLDTTDDRFGVTFRYTTPDLRITNENRLQRYQDATAGTSRIGMGPRVTVAYARALGERLQLSGNYVFDYLRTEQTVRSSSPQLVPVDLEPIAGLYVREVLPDVTAPMAPEPRLIDRSFDATTGITVGGPLALTYQNVGVDLGRFAEAGQLRVHVRSPSGTLVPSGEGIEWRVYTSQDGLHWAQATVLDQPFEAAMSAWVLTFQASAARYFKAVNVGVIGPEAEITEVQLFVLEEFQPDQTLTGSAVRQSLGLSLSLRPWPKLQVALSSQTNVTANSPYGGETQWSADTSNGLSAALGPWGALRYTASAAQSWARRASGEEISSLAATGSARYQPIERYAAEALLRASVDAIRPAGARSWEQASTWAATVRNEATILPALRASLGAGAMRQTIVDGSISDFLTGTAQVQATLLDGVQLQLDAALQRRWSLQGDTGLQDRIPLFQVVTYEVYGGELRYRPSPQLGLAARLGYTAGATASGWSQTYRANWTPFPGGTVQLAFDYSEEVDPLSGQSFRRAFASPRWVLNRHATLQLSYNMLRGAGTTPSIEQQNLYVTFTVKL